MNEKLQAALAEARTLLASGDLVGAKAKREEAEGYIAAINEAKELDAVAAKYAPTRPTLPNTQGQDAVVPAVADGAGSTKSAPAEEAGDLSVKTQQAAYVTRFNDESTTIKGILTDLHGPNFQGAYWAQKAAFNRYLRGGEPNLKLDDRKLLSGIVMNPAAVKMALNQGTDDLASFRATMVEAADTLGGLSLGGAKLTFVSV